MVFLLHPTQRSTLGVFLDYSFISTHSGGPTLLFPHCVNSCRSPIRILLLWIWLPKQFSLFSLVLFVILREETFLVLWISSLLNPAELKVTSYKAASKLHYKYFSLIFNRFVTKLLFLTKAWGPMAPPLDGHIGPGKWSQNFNPDVSCLDPTLIRADPPFWSLQTCLWPQKAHLWPFWGPMAPPDGHFGPGKWSQHIPPDVSCLDPTLIRTDPPFWSLQACLWLGVPFMALFGQFLAIKWVKMAGSKKSPLGSRPSSTQWTRYMYWFSRNDNFENPPPLTHCVFSGWVLSVQNTRMCTVFVYRHPAKWRTILWK